ncbi:MAG: hypothetical protein IJE46_02430 [Clostridia bacterium]|nr:hypothetical protein [Clostridia bacterium]
MLREHIFDEFFNAQPECEFIELLKAHVHKEPPMNWGLGAMQENEFSADGMYLNPAFPDPENLLETAYEDFNAFLNVCKISGNKFPVNIVHQKTSVFESYEVKITKNGITVSAGDTEGIRRALVWIEDELSKNEGPFLKEKTISRFPHIEDRITRGFFSPTNRPPKNGDELSDDIDYYPEEYLNRLAHDGTNGLWIYTRFMDILPPGMIKEYGKGFESRIEKLRNIIKKCARYGIKVYVFAIEPVSCLSVNGDIIKNYPQVKGTVLWTTEYTFCTETEFGKAYCIDSTKTMAELLPGLGGYINITVGERPTNCSNSATNDCPHCSHIPRGKILADTVEFFCEGFRRAKSDIKFVSWTYGHREWETKDIEDYVKYAPEEAYLMQNFDDMGTPEQLDKKRLAMDYWLSYAGPSDLFINTANACKKYGKKLFAKMQICCSHEVASVPYLPVPGLIFEKFKGAHELGVKGVMECWYFGNYPSLMSKAAGELSFLHDFSNEDSFSEHLASIYWGRTHAKQVVKAWKLFTEGYKNYPTNIMFSYYGPMHDSVVWQLHLIPKNFSLPRSWMSTDRCDGDRIDEGLVGIHTLQEADILTSEMSEKWSAGIKELEGIPQSDCYNYTEQITCAKALGVLFKSGHNIIKFYQLREKLGFEEGNLKEILSQMEEIVKQEIALTKEMIPLCNTDKRLGYHSEAENFKFFPLKLKDRVLQLEKLLATEFPKVSQRIEEGLPPLEYYKGIEDGVPHYQMGKGSLDNAKWLALTDDKSYFKAAYDKENLYFEFKSDAKFGVRFTPEFVLMHVYPTVEITKDIEFKHSDNNPLYHALIIDGGLEKLEKVWQITKIPSNGMHFIVTLKRTDINWTKDIPMKLRIGHEIGRFTSIWAQEPNPVCTLGKGDVSPGQFGWLMP